MTREALQEHVERLSHQVPLIDIVDVIAENYLVLAQQAEQAGNDTDSTWMTRVGEYLKALTCGHV